MELLSAWRRQGFSAAGGKRPRAAIFQRAARRAFPQGSMKRVATPRTSARREEAVPCEVAKGGGRYTHTNPAWYGTGRVSEIDLSALVTISCEKLNVLRWSATLGSLNVAP